MWVWIIRKIKGREKDFSNNGNSLYLGHKVSYGYLAVFAWTFPVSVGIIRALTRFGSYISRENAATHTVFFGIRGQSIREPAVSAFSESISIFCGWMGGGGRGALNQLGNLRFSQFLGFATFCATTRGISWIFLIWRLGGGGITDFPLKTADIASTHVIQHQEAPRKNRENFTFLRKNRRNFSR